MKKTNLLLWVLSFVALTSCGRIKFGADDNGVLSEISLKNMAGNYQSYAVKDIDHVSVTLSSRDGRRYGKTFYGDSIPNICTAFALGSPAEVSPTTVSQTGTVVITFKAASFLGTRSFSIEDSRKLRDQSFSNVVYTAKNSITQEWLEQQK
jgi:hypothetical protein